MGLRLIVFEKQLLQLFYPVLMLEKKVKCSGVASLNLMLGHIFLIIHHTKLQVQFSYRHAGSYVHLFMVVVQQVHGMTIAIAMLVATQAYGNFSYT